LATSSVTDIDDVAAFGASLTHDILTVTVFTTES
jgi:hypothetical protein